MPETLRKTLVELLKNFESHLENDDLRQQVIALIPVHYNLRDLGSSLKGLNDARSGAARMLEYLKKYQGLIIKGDELMVVSGIHDYPRRIRELRKQMGWQILSGVTVSEQAHDDQDEQLDLEAAESMPDMRTDDYILNSLDQDRDAAFRWRVANEIRREKGSVTSKILKFFLQNVNKPVSGEELRYVAKDKTEWARRTRELRTEQGWSIVTKSTGRPDLPIGMYVLESEKQGLPHDRAIPDRTRRAVLKRDGYACQKCGWNRTLWTPDDPRHLEVHHKQHHARGGSNEEINLITLCTICHDEIHAKERLTN